ncbi:MAG: M48 family metallopeptidase [Acidobacteria bacterium]|nr:M48 family metallopeptidase [Acidobacteriota bacterium]
MISYEAARRVAVQLSVGRKPHPQPGAIPSGIVHELVHLRHRGHDRDYWQALGRVMPDYERRRKELRQRGGGGGLAW